MTNDNEHISKKVRAGFNEVIALAMEGGMHPIDIIAELHRQLDKLREDTARVDKEGGMGGKDA